MTRWLAQHPDVFFSEVKVPFHFGTDLDMIPKRRYRDLDTYLALFDAAAGYKRRGESTPFYLYSRNAAREISEFAPDARLIVMLRNPVDMMYSMHSRNLKDGNEIVSDFHQALELEEARVEGRHIPKTAHFPQGLFYRRIARYGEQLERYLDAFPRDQIHVVIFEDMKLDAQQTMRNVLRFLNIDEQVPIIFDRANESGTLRSPALTGFLKNPPIYFRVLPQSMREAITWRLNRFNLRPVPPAPMEAGFRSQLIEDFRDEIDSLGRILETDLSVWTAGISAHQAGSSPNLHTSRGGQP